MLEQRIKKHDRTQFEIKFHFPLEKKQKSVEYNADLYFFLPLSLGISKTTYRKVNFYDSIQNYVRLKTPTYTLNGILEGADSPFAKLEKTYKKISLKEPSKEYFEEFENQTKLFCSIVNSSIRDNTYYLTHDAPVREIDKLFHNYVSSIKQITQKYRDLLIVISLPNVPNKFVSIFKYGDEYLSLMIEKYSFRILEYLRKRKFPFDKNAISDDILDIIRKEVEYRKENGYKSLPDEKNESEEMMFRFSVLKKYFNSVFSIETNKEQEGVLLEQILFAIAAGFAMVFATAVAFISQSIYGNLTMPFFIALVVSYMFKDRIKEITRIALKNVFSQKIYDYKTKLFLDAKYKLGYIRTSFSFVKFNKLPKEVIEIRNKNRTPEFDNTFAKENIILFRKNINLFSGFRKSLTRDYEFNSITDILRFDVSRFLTKMDEPRKPIYILTENGYKKTHARRVYHVNLIIKYERERKTDFQRYRLVLTKRGIERIEFVTNYTF